MSKKVLSEKERVEEQKRLVAEQERFANRLPVEVENPEKPVKAKVVKESKEEAKKEEKATATPKPKTAKKVPPKRADGQPAKRPATKKVSDRPAAKVYHVSQHSDGGWQVKAAKAEKALKRFATQAEAIAYAKEVADSQEGSIRVHSRGGQIRKA